MNGNWILKVYAQPQKETAIKKICLRAGTKKQGNYYINNYIKKPRKEIKKLRRIGVKFSCYRVEYERASNYRHTFFARTKGPYRCRYCNKPIAKNKLVVDHIIPVAKAQKKKSARIMLALHRCGTVNDIRNLAPACHNCNSRKSDKMGFWVIRGWLGRYKIYWFTLKILRFLCICLMVIGFIWVLKKIGGT